MYSLNVNKIDFTLKILKIFLDFYNRRDIRFFYAYGGRGSGKTKNTIRYIIYMIINHNQNWIVLRKTEVSLKTSSYQSFLDEIDEAGLSRVFDKQGDRLIYRLNGCHVLFRGLFNSERIKSLSEGYHGAFLEEADQFSYVDFTVFHQTFRNKDIDNFKFILLSNMPRDGKNNWLYEFFFIDDDDNKAVLHVDYTMPHMKGLLSKEWIKDAKNVKDRDIDLYNRDYIANYDHVVSDINVYKFDISKQIKLLDIDDTYRVYYGLDFGYTNPNAFIEVYISDKHNIIYISREKMINGLTASEIGHACIDRLFNKEELDNGTNKDVRIIADNSNPPVLNELKKYGYNIRPVDKDEIILGIQAIKKYNIYVNPNCKHFIKEIKGYRWKQTRSKHDNNLIIEENPVKENDHLMDALRYALNHLWNEKAFNKDNLQFAINKLKNRKRQM